MKPISSLVHPWNLTADEARAQQTALRRRVILTDEISDVRTVAGVDLSFSADGETAFAVVVVLSFPECQVLEARYAAAPTPMPYIPGLLSFRESPAALEAFAQIERVPDLIFVDGQGQAHPRGFGIACHLGVLLDVPSIGVAKSFLYGQYNRALTLEPGTSTPLLDKAGTEAIGAVVQAKMRTNPLFISPGHKISVSSATQWVLDCVRGYRLPEPTRQAHLHITAYRKERDREKKGETSESA